MSKLRAPLKAALRVPVRDAATVARMWSGVRGRMAPRRALRILAPVLVAAAAAAAIWLPDWSHRQATGPLTLADGAAIGTLETTVARVVGFADGSTVTLGADTVLEPLVNDKQRFEVALRRGRATFELGAHHPRQWTVESGVTIEVMASKFAVSRSETEVEVHVYGGELLVRGEDVPGRVQRLTTRERPLVTLPLRQRATLMPAAPALTTVPSVAPAPTTAMSPVPTIAPSPLPTTAPPVKAISAPARPARSESAKGASSPVVPSPSVGEAPPAAAAWRPLADERRYGEAYRALGKDGVAEVTVHSSSMEELLELADVARRSGHAAEAIPALDRAVEKFPGDPRAALAAFTRGRIEADELAQPQNAARSFSRAVELGLPASLTEDAFLRLVESQLAAGDRQAAVDSVDRYHVRFPRGRFTERLNQLLQRR